MQDVLDRTFYLRVATPYRVFKSSKSEDRDNAEGDNAENNIESQASLSMEGRYFPVNKSRKHSFFGYEDEYIKMKTTDSDTILSSTKIDNFKLKCTILGMVSTNVVTRIKHEIQNDTYTTEDEKKELEKFLSSVVVKTSENAGQFSVHEITTQDIFREIFLQTVCEKRDSLNDILCPIMMEYCIRACPFVRKRGGAPIFTVEYVNSRAGWRVTWYHPEPLTQTLSLGVPKTVMSACGLQYDVSLVDSLPRELMSRDDEDDEDDEDEDDEQEIEMV